MSIHFSCELTDPDTEALLSFLLNLTSNDCDRMLELIDRAKDWLNLDAPTPSHNGDAHKSALLHVVVDLDGPSVSLPAQTPVLSEPV